MTEVRGRDWSSRKAIAITITIAAGLIGLSFLNIATHGGERRLLPLTEWGIGRRPLFEAESGQGRSSKVRKIGSITKYGILEVDYYDTQP